MLLCSRAREGNTPTLANQKKKMKLLIAGSRNIFDKTFVFETLDKLNKPVHEVVSGAARGPDSIGEAWAEANNLPVTRFPAMWGEYGKSAGYIRNIEMAQYADEAVVFWDGSSKGTAHMIQQMKKLKKPVEIVNCA